MFFGSKDKKESEIAAAEKHPETAPVFLRKILLVMDGSGSAQKAADFAVNLALSTGCSLQAVYVVDTATLDYLQQMKIFIKEERQTFELELEQKGQRYLDILKEQAAKLEIPVETFIAHGRQHQAILHLAKREAVSAIVMGGWCNEAQRKDTTCVERRLILDLATCPVMVIKGNEDTGERC